MAGQNTKIRQMIQEKFGYVKNIPKENDKHADVTDRNGKKGKNPAYLPIEQYRDVVKALMSATSTETDGKIEDVIDFNALKRLANKNGFSKEFTNNLNTIHLELDKGKSADREVIKTSWELIKKHIPYWFLGMIPNEKKEELAAEDKTVLNNLLDMMKEFNKEAEKDGKEKAENTEHAGRDTEAKKNLDAARKSAGMDKDAASEKKLSKGTKVEVENDKKDEKSLDKAHKQVKPLDPKEDPVELKEEYNRLTERMKVLETKLGIKKA